MYLIKGYCAGILIFSEEAQEKELPDFFSEKKRQWEKGNLMITFGAGETQVATELCIDVYDKATGRYRTDLCTAYKPK